MKNLFVLCCFLAIGQQTLKAQFGPRQFIGTDNKSYAYEDIDSDGDIDMIIGYGSGNYIAVSYNDGSGEFSDPTAIVDSPESPKWIIADDIDSDGDVDLVYVSDDFGSSNDDLMVALWSGTEYIQTAYNFPDLLNKRIYVADLNGDGHDEVIASDATNSNSAMYIYHNNGDGSLQSYSLQPWTISGGVQGNGVLDIEGDNDEDFIFAPGSGNHLFVLKHLEGTTYERDTIADVGNIDSMAIMDYDDDGDEDIIFAGFDLKYIENMGGGVFEGSSNVLNSSTTMDRVVVGDLDGDGDLDLLTSRASSDILRAHFNLGGGNFESGNDWEYLGETHYVTHARDMNNDGLVDLISDEDIDDNYYRINEFDFCFSLGPSINVSNDRVICPGEETSIFASSTADVIWIGLGEENSYVVSPEENTEYIAQATDENGCEVSGNVVVTILPVPTLELPTLSIMCTNEVVELEAISDGEVLWSGYPAGSSITVSLTNDTTFNVSATSSDGCITTGEFFANVSLYEYPAYSISEDQTICEGDSIYIGGSSSNSIYSWDGNWETDSILVSPVNNTYYYFYASNSPYCTHSDSVLVSVNTPNQVNLELNGIVLQTDEDYVSYQWYLDGVLLSDEEMNSIELDVDGVYHVDAIDANGCETSAEYDYVFIGLEEFGKKVESSVYPNPMNNNSLVSYSGSELPLELHLIDGQGKVLRSLNSASQQGSWIIERTGLASGLYFIKASFEDGHQECTRVLVH